jgi:hypothetical protein
VVELDIRGLQIAMDDVLLMRGLDAVNQLPDDRQRVLEAQGTGESLALDQFHDQEVATYIKKLADVGAVDGGDGPSLALEPLAELLGGDLNRDIAAQARVAGAVHFAHAAGSNLREDLIRTKFLAYAETRHV